MHQPAFGSCGVVVVVVVVVVIEVKDSGRKDKMSHAAQHTTIA